MTPALQAKGALQAFQSIPQSRLFMLCQAIMALRKIVNKSSLERPSSNC